jgi:CubicO group peptidase (beta-lactamase class C family)
VFRDLAADPLRSAPDTRFVYSDLNFVTLMNVAEKASGEPMEQYLERRIFRPLGMRDTAFHLNAEQRARCAPTTMVHGKFLQGDVHDPTAQMCSGVGGDAGLFSTADDLAKFAWMLLSSDNHDEKRYPLSPATVRLMTTPHSPPGLAVRGLGWDIDSPYSHVKGELMPPGSFGHTGFTGTFIWVDPSSDTFVIGLSNRVHPDGKGNPLRMWAQVSNVVEGIVRPQVLPPRSMPAGVPAP